MIWFPKHLDEKLINQASIFNLLLSLIRTVTKEARWGPTTKQAVYTVLCTGKHKEGLMICIYTISRTRYHLLLERDQSRRDEHLWKQRFRYWHVLIPLSHSGFCISLFRSEVGIMVLWNIPPALLNTDIVPVLLQLPEFSLIT